jgi:hypothetical protein
VGNTLGTEHADALQVRCADQDAMRPDERTAGQAALVWVSLVKCRGEEQTRIVAWVEGVRSKDGGDLWICGPVPRVTLRQVVLEGVGIAGAHEDADARPEGHVVHYAVAAAAADTSACAEDLTGCRRMVAAEDRTEQRRLAIVVAEAKQAAVAEEDAPETKKGHGVMAPNPV